MKSRKIQYSFRVITTIFILILSKSAISQSAATIMERAGKIGFEILAVYRQLHAAPELSREEKNTSFFLKKQMEANGYGIIDSLGYHSFAAVLKNGPGPVIMFRTDMDGLPVKEATGLSYASNAMVKRGDETLPSMHACGHDVHMSVWLGVAKLLAADKTAWSGTLVFLAQSAEETGQGAKAAIKSKNFSRIPRPDYQMAIHSHSGLSAGTVGFCDGYALAAVDMMNITIYGKGGHGAAPEKCIDPILIASQFVSNIQSVVSRNLSSNNPAVITVGSFQGGTAHNVIPDKVDLKLTIRTYDTESRKLVLERIRTIGDNLARAAGMGEDKLPQYDVLDMSIPPVYNDMALGGKLKAIISEFGGPDAVQTVKPVMIGEDFGFFRNAYDSETPSYLLWLGTIASERMKGDFQNNLPSLHSSKYYPDAELAIPKGIGLVAGCLMKLMEKY